MKKSTAYRLFDNSARAVAAHTGVTRHAVYHWPEELPHRIKLLVLGARVVLNARIKQTRGEQLDELERELVND